MSTNASSRSTKRHARASSARTAMWTRVSSSLPLPRTRALAPTAAMPSRTFGACKIVWWHSHVSSIHSSSRNIVTISNSTINSPNSAYVVRTTNSLTRIRRHNANNPIPIPSSTRTRTNSIGVSITPTNNNNNNNNTISNANVLRPCRPPRRRPSPNGLISSARQLHSSEGSLPSHPTSSHHEGTPQLAVYRRPHTPRPLFRASRPTATTSRRAATADRHHTLTRIPRSHSHHSRSTCILLALRCP
mmetsp:Transcript_11569/g.35379  ORF Transcript_11569/g.35379 Transcript_11569/m.35379 type:complete len:246 (+) Transcript_11569:1294-2031(+)